MSAYMCDHEHIRYLVDSAMSVRITGSGPLYWYPNNSPTADRLACGDRQKASEVGQMLWDENWRSIQHRYPDCQDKNGSVPCKMADQPFQYGEHRGFLDVSHDPRDVLAATRRYSYQSCEHPGWDTSTAHAFIQALETRAIMALTADCEWGAPKACYRSKRAAV